MNQHQNKIRNILRQKIDIKNSPKGEIKELRHIVKYLTPHKLHIAGIFVALILASLSVLSLGQGVKYLVDNGLSAGDGQILDAALLVLFIVIIILALATYFRFYLVTQLGEMVIADIRKDIYNRLINISPSFFETKKVGDIISRITADTTILQIVIGSSISIALRNILLLFGGLLMLILTSSTLTLYIAFLIPLIILPIIFLGKKVRIFSQESQDKVAILSSFLEETLSGIKTVQSYCRENKASAIFSEHTNKAYETALKRIKIRSLLTALVIIIAFGSVGMILWVGGKNVISGEMSAGDLSSFIFYTIIVASSFGAISQVIGDIQRAAGAAEGLMKLLAVQSDIVEVDNPVTLPKNSKNIPYVGFNNVSFSYPSKPDIRALYDISFEVFEGEKIAIVGPSGAGKTTIMELLMRFYEPSKGNINISGVDISQLKLSDLREQFSYVSQESMIFSSSAGDNIAYGLNNASQQEITKAAKNAMAYDFIDSLTDGFDTYLGEKGVRLSGGERQRIAIARAIAANPKILLLDEATSALDSENEQLVQQAFDKLADGRTVIVIAHRLATIMKADKIIIMDKGKIQDIGTHEKLLETNKLYKKLAKLQFIGD